MSLALKRLYHQRLSHHLFATPAEAVAWFGAVQGQEYMPALWAIGQRVQDATETSIEQAIADRSIVRTWFMRGTLHYVAANDVRWMLRITAPRLKKMLGTLLRQNKLGIDDTMLQRAYEVMVREMQGGKQMSRDALADSLKREGFPTQGWAFIYIVQNAQADALLCQGTREGKQQTFTLLDEWLPPTPLYERDEALARFALRYFTSHGPATAQDFAWWAGISLTEARLGLEGATAQLIAETVDGVEYWLSAEGVPPLTETPHIRLLATYDEFLIAYKDRSASFIPEFHEQITHPDYTFLSPLILNGKGIGGWKRTLKKKQVIVSLTLFRALTEAEQAALAIQLERYGRFLGLEVVVTYLPIKLV